MTPPESPASFTECEEDNETPGVPGFRTWRGVYWFVMGWFMLVVILLALFTRAFA
ncbi:MAG TPA: hypothetical protein VGR78_00445 [Verrucomicrobiae bacterium]|jgi:hypothetical protein|nr:hypothetical protein [Verrucomicrobiae bacterium]